MNVKIPEAILAKRETNNKEFFYIKWKGLDTKYNSWEEKSNLLNNKNLDSLEKNFDEVIVIKTEKEKNEKKKILKFGKNLTFDSKTLNLGNFLNGDIPKKIKKVRKINNSIEFIIEWKKKEDDNKPLDSIVSNKEFRNYAPEFLFNFYEKKTIFQDYS